MNTLYTTNVDYLLTAEFDNKIGAIVRDQYPSVIPGFEYEAEKDYTKKHDVFNLASLMIPSSAEYSTNDEPDTTVFMLYRDRKTMKYGLFPSRQVDRVLCFVNVVYSQEDKYNSRGRNIKAIALGTTMVDFMAFRPFVLECLHRFMRLGNEDDATPILKACFKLLNRVELSFVKRLHRNRHRQSLLRSLGDSSRLERWFDEGNVNGSMFKGLLKCHHHDRYTNRITLQRGKIIITLHGYRPKAEFIDLMKIPLEFDLLTWATISWNMRYNSRISKFLLNFIPLLHKRKPDDSFHFKLIIYSSKMKTSELSQFIIAISNLMGITGSTAFFRNKPCLTLPFVDVSIIDPLKEYLSLRTSGIFLIMGTTNPIFKAQDGLYDYYYDLDNELIDENANLHGKSMSSKWNLIGLKKLPIVNSISPATTVDTYRVGFLQKMIECIEEEETDFSKVLLSFQKVNAMQLLQLDYQVGNINPGYLFDEYIAKYRDAIVFEDIFKIESLRILQILKTLNDIMNNLYQLNLPLPEKADLLSQLKDSFTEIYFFINTDEDNLEEFLATCIRYPFVFPCSQYNLQENNLAKIDLKQELKNCIKENKTWISLAEHSSEPLSVLSSFNKDRSSNLFCSPLLFNPHVKVDKNPTSEHSDSMIKPSSNGSIGRRRSLNIKHMVHRGRSRGSISDRPLLRPTSETSKASTISSSGRFSRSESSSELSSKLNNVDLNRLIKNIKYLAYKIMYAVQSHFIGGFVIDQSLSPFFRTVLASFNLEQPFRAGTPSSGDTSDTRLGTPLSE